MLNGMAFKDCTIQAKDGTLHHAAHNIGTLITSLGNQYISFTLDDRSRYQTNYISPKSKVSITCAKA
jgi:hypothetical protein